MSINSKHNIFLKTRLRCILIQRWRRTQHSFVPVWSAACDMLWLCATGMMLVVPGMWYSYTAINVEIRNFRICAIVSFFGQSGCNTQLQGCTRRIKITVRAAKYVSSVLQQLPAQNVHYFGHFCEKIGSSWLSFLQKYLNNLTNQNCFGSTLWFFCIYVHDRRALDLCSYIRRGFLWVQVRDVWVGHIAILHKNWWKKSNSKNYRVESHRIDHRLRSILRTSVLSINIIILANYQGVFRLQWFNWCDHEKNGKSKNRVFPRKKIFTTPAAIFMGAGLMHGRTTLRNMRVKTMTLATFFPPPMCPTPIAWFFERFQKITALWSRELFPSPS